MNRRVFLTLIGSATVASATRLHVPFESLKHKDFTHHRSLQMARPDVVLKGNDFEQLKSLAQKIHNTKLTVGYGNFNLLGFDEMITVGKNFSKVGAYTKGELELFESLFFRRADEYGFYGEKVLTSLTDNIVKKETVKIPRTGHFLYKGEAYNKYQKIQEDLDGSVILTSGVRSIVKQMDLFLRKVVRSRGNISVATYSLAPAGYSFHGVGDFDVGKVGYGYRNFTDAFAKTDEFKKLIDSGYINIRYGKNNPFGVRYEPWHIKVV